MEQLYSTGMMCNTIHEKVNVGFAFRKVQQAREE